MTDSLMHKRRGELEGEDHNIDVHATRLISPRGRLYSRQQYMKWSKVDGLVAKVAEGACSM
jgi:hypothetical protein